MRRSHEALPVSGRVDLRYLAVVRKSDRKFVFKCVTEQRHTPSSSSSSSSSSAPDSEAMSKEEAAVQTLVHKQSFEDKVTPGKRILLKNKEQGMYVPEHCCAIFSNVHSRMHVGVDAELDCLNVTQHYWSGFVGRSSACRIS